MGKKEKSKARLDKFYYMAKEHGFRSRAAFKLIQLNKKYDFLSNAKCVVDLCAAPGGWLQVAAKYMPVASIKIGIDLDPIKPVKGCVTYQADITTPRCINLIKKELKHFKADVVMNDGAPNVGAEWSKDAYNQAELCLYALKVATDVLRKGGTFITKVFRSKDYNSLLFVFNHFFNKVEATKPQASRQQSAEIFVVCQGYKAPDTIDPKFLDPRFAFAEVEEEEESTNKISSLKKLMDQKVNRKGYGERETLYAETDLIEFLECSDPYQYLASYNKFKVDDKSMSVIADKKLQPPEDLAQICSDLKVLGRRELFSLLKLRSKYQNSQEKDKKKLKAQEQGKVPEKELDDDEKEDEVDKELEETIKRVDKERKRAEKKERERKQKSDMRLKMSVIANTDIHNGNDELLFDKRTLERLQQMDIENLDYQNSDDEAEEENQETKGGKKNGMKEAENNDDDSNIDDDVKRIDRMAEEMDGYFKQKKEYQMDKDKKLAKKEKKRKALLEQQRQKKEDESEEEALGNDDIREKRVKFQSIEQNEDSSENDDDLDSDNDQDDDDNGLFVNPLLMNQKQNKKSNDDSQEVSEGEWSDEDDAQDKKSKKKDKKKESTLGKRKKRDGDDKDLFDNTEIEVVPQEKFDEGYSSMDSDDIAETRALAKLMLRKKARNEILDMTYNRYSTHDDKSVLPSWFIEDEQRHYKPPIPVTKEMIQEEKRILKAYNERPSKKVMEAKARKKKKLARAMNKVKSKAQVIVEQDINEGSKMRQIEKLYKREKNKMKETKSYVVSRNFRNVGNAKGGRNTKFVDKRMKKETRAKKRIEKNGKSKKIGKRRR